MYLHTLPPGSACDTGSIFKQREASLNSEFSYFKTGCLTRFKGTSQSLERKKERKKERNIFSNLWRALDVAQAQTFGSSNVREEKIEEEKIEENAGEKRRKKERRERKRREQGREIGK